MADAGSVLDPPHLFSPLTVRSLTLRNRIGVSPMCMYSCDEQDGMANIWHVIHLGSRAVGGAGLVFTEATAVRSEGRISPEDLGIWHDGQIEPLRPITAFIKSQGAVAGMQLAHAGRKASTFRPWAEQHGQVPAPQGGWHPVGPSALPFAPNDAAPTELSKAEIGDIIKAFAAAALRALEAGFEIVEVHAAHGYLIHEFLSPLSNTRQDEYGGSLTNRLRLLREVVDAIRRCWPERLPLFVRLSATDWSDKGGWDLEQTVQAAHMLKEHGADVVDCSSGGLLPRVHIPEGPGYQVTFAERVRHGAQIPTAAVGLISSAQQADQIVRSGQADMVLLARAMLRNPYWPLQAAKELGQEVRWAPQYLRAKL